MTYRGVHHDGDGPWACLCSSILFQGKKIEKFLRGWLTLLRSRILNKLSCLKNILICKKTKQEQSCLLE